MTGVLTQLAANPYPLYAQLRKLPNPGPNLVSHAEVREALNHPDLVVDKLNDLRRVLPAELADGALARTLRSILAFQEGDGHRRLRRVLAKRLVGKQIDGQRDTIERFTAELLDKVEGDVVKDLAYPLPAMVISNLLGIDSSHVDRLLAWSDTLVRIMSAGTIEPATAALWERQMADMRELVAQLCADRRREPRDDLISSLLEMGDETLSFDELAANVLFMVTAGHETSTDLLASAILTLLRHPSQLAALRADPGLIDGAVEEVFRYESPLQNVGRVPRVDVTIGGRVLRAGRLVNLLIGAANRDPAVFEDPDTFDITRDPNPHLGFGFGAHFCLGAGLARLEARVALPMVLARFPRLELVEHDVPWRSAPGFRGPARVPVRWT
jgi:pimeloyl-[acyl-carrier protein] synthase